MRTIHWLLASSVLCASTVFAQSAPVSVSLPAWVSELLSLAAPAPPAGLPGAQPAAANDEPTVQGAPAEDAPLAVLGRYWAQMVTFNSPKPNDAVRRRLLAFVKSEPAYLSVLVKALPTDPATATEVRGIYDREHERQTREWNRDVKAYLQDHAGSFHQELLAEARKAHDDAKGGYVEQEEELVRLVQVDWPLAEPLLMQLAASKGARTALLAETLLYRHAVAEGPDDQAARLRTLLKAVVEDRKALGYCRDKAADALLETKWEGRDAWYLSLFHDPTLRRMIDGNYLRQPLTGPVWRDRDHWIPILTKLVDDPDRAVHDMAVEGLVSFNLTSRRRDALLPLLPWLFDPKWSSADDRLRLIQTVDQLDMKEAVPGLIAVLDNSDSSARFYAAESLAHFRDPRAVPALERALAKEKEGNARRHILKGLIASGGVSAERAAKAVEEFARFTATAEGEQAWERAEYSLSKAEISSEIALGGYVAREGAEEAATVLALQARATELEHTDAKLAARLRTLVAAWHSAAADRAVVEALSSDKASGAGLAEALSRRKQVALNAAEPLRRLAAGNDVRAAVAAVLLADHAREAALLAADNTQPRAALLAAARMVREPLDLAVVGLLLKAEDAGLRRAAEEYLAAEDSAAARRLVLAEHKNEVLILGAREAYDPGHESYPAFDQLETQLAEEVKEEKAEEEVFALLTAGYWGNAGQVVVRVSGGEAELRFHRDPARYLERKLSRAEWNELHAWLEAQHVDDLGPLNQSIVDGMQLEYVHLTRAGGRRVFMNNPGLGRSGGSVYHLLCERLRGLLAAAPMALHYRMEKTLPGFEVLVADNRLMVANVWAEDSDLRAAVEPVREYHKLTVASNGVLAVADVDLGPEGKLEWARLEGGHLKPAAVPAAFPGDDPLHVIPAELDKEERERGHIEAHWAQTVGAKSYRASGWGEHKSGLWEFAAGKAERLVVEGEFFQPVLSPDGRWAVLAAAKESWAEPNFAVRVELATGKLMRLAVAEADRVRPVAWLPERGRALVTRYGEQGREKLNGPIQPEFWLVEPETGAVEEVKGEFRPLEEEARPLQPAVGGGFWAAIYDREQRLTRIGIYDREHFRFSERMTVPAMNFSSGSMWVDEAAGKVYLAYGGQLLRFDLTR